MQKAQVLLFSRKELFSASSSRQQGYIKPKEAISAGILG
jgi:hypothetical protein